MKRRRIFIFERKTLCILSFLILVACLFPIPVISNVLRAASTVPVIDGTSVTVYEQTGGVYPHEYTVSALMGSGGTFHTIANEYYSVSSDGTYVKIHCYSPEYRGGSNVGSNIVAVRLDGVTGFPEGLWASFIQRLTLGYNGIEESAVNALGPEDQIGPFLNSYCTYLGDQHSEIVIGFKAEENVEQFKIIQGNEEWIVSPVIETQSAVDFYDYHSESGHTPFMESHISKIYLYEDTSTGELSLVFHQGIDNDTPGTMSAKYDFVGIPSGAYVSVSDDPEGIGSSPRSPELDEFSLDLEPEAYLANGNNSDGGVLSGLPTAGPWSITIYPEFMTGIYSWKYVRSDGTEIDLRMDKPITICKGITWEPFKSRAMYVWGFSHGILRSVHENELNSEMNKLFSFCNSHNINTVFFLTAEYEDNFLVVDSLIENDDYYYNEFEIFLTEAHKQGISVHALIGGNDLTQPEKRELIYNSVASILDFNQDHKDPFVKFDGIHLDIEFYNMDTWIWNLDILHPTMLSYEENQDIVGNYLEALEEIMSTIENRNLNIIFGVDIPTWFDSDVLNPELSLATDLCKIPHIQIMGTFVFNDERKYVNEHVQNLVDYVTIMDYWDSDHKSELKGYVRGEIEYAESIGKFVVIAVETQHANPTSSDCIDIENMVNCMYEPDNQNCRCPQDEHTFDEERHELESTIEELENEYISYNSFADGGIAVHYYGSYKQWFDIIEGNFVWIWNGLNGDVDTLLGKVHGVFVRTGEFVDPYVDDVDTERTNILGSNNRNSNAKEALGIPDDLTVSLGVGGEIILDMGNGEDIFDGSGNDLTVYESIPDESGNSEGYFVYVSNSKDGPWEYLGSGLGISEFDLASASLTHARYVKIVDDGDGDPNSEYPGCDLDALKTRDEFRFREYDVDPILLRKLIDENIQVHLAYSFDPAFVADFINDTESTICYILNIIDNNKRYFEENDVLVSGIQLDMEQYVRSGKYGDVDMKKYCCLLSCLEKKFGSEYLISIASIATWPQKYGQDWKNLIVYTDFVVPMFYGYFEGTDEFRITDVFQTEEYASYYILYGNGEPFYAGIPTYDMVALFDKDGNRLKCWLDPDIFTLENLKKWDKLFSFCTECNTSEEASKCTFNGDILYTFQIKDENWQDPDDGGKNTNGDDCDCPEEKGDKDKKDKDKEDKDKKDKDEEDKDKKVEKCFKNRVIKLDVTDKYGIQVYSRTVKNAVTEACASEEEVSNFLKGICLFRFGTTDPKEYEAAFSEDANFPIPDECKNLCKGKSSNVFHTIVQCDMKGIRFLTFTDLFLWFLKRFHFLNFFSFVRLALF